MDRFNNVCSHLPWVAVTTGTVIGLAERVINGVPAVRAIPFEQLCLGDSTLETVCSIGKSITWNGWMLRDLLIAGTVLSAATCLDLRNVGDATTSVWRKFQACLHENPWLWHVAEVTVTAVAPSLFIGTTLGCLGDSFWKRVGFLAIESYALGSAMRMISKVDTPLARGVLGLCAASLAVINGVYISQVVYWQNTVFETYKQAVFGAAVITGGIVVGKVSRLVLHALSKEDVSNKKRVELLNKLNVFLEELGKVSEEEEKWTEELFKKVNSTLIEIDNEFKKMPSLLIEAFCEFYAQEKMELGSEAHCHTYMYMDELCTDGLSRLMDLDYYCERSSGQIHDLATMIRKELDELKPVGNYPSKFAGAKENFEEKTKRNELELVNEDKLELDKGLKIFTELGEHFQRILQLKKLLEIRKLNNSCVKKDESEIDKLSSNEIDELFASYLRGEIEKGSEAHWRMYGCLDTFCADKFSQLSCLGAFSERFSEQVLTIANGMKHELDKIKPAAGYPSKFDRKKGLFDEKANKRSADGVEEKKAELTEKEELELREGKEIFLELIDLWQRLVPQQEKVVVSD